METEVKQVNLTKQQQDVVDARSGTILVEACPGSGKTATLVERCRVLPAAETKVVLAFNKRAAEDFSKRMGSVPGSDVRTFHSFCYREIMRDPRGFGYNRKPTQNEGTLFAGMLAANSPTTLGGWAKLGWDEDFAKDAEHSMHDEDLQEVIRSTPKVMVSERRQKYDEAIEVVTARAVLGYREWIANKNLWTFDSMVRLVAKNASNLRRAGHHVMVDEYQDVDRFQFDIATALAAAPGTKSFVCVGDPNQRIYEWRGALASAFTDAATVFKGASVLSLTTNFRSYDEILEHAETVCPVGMVGVRGRQPGSVSFSDPKSDDVSALAIDGQYAKSAILCRYNRDCLMWNLKLAKRGIPVFLIGKGDFWRAEHIKLAKAAWEKGMKEHEFFASDGWLAIMRRKKLRDNPDLADEYAADVKFIINLSEKDMDIIEQSLQREDGLRISTIHRTKGLEFDRVMVSGVTERLKDETFVYYVAVTRARNKLILA